MFGYIDTDSTVVYRYVSWSAFSLYLSLYLCRCPSMLSVICMYVSKRSLSGQQSYGRMIFDFLILRVYVRLLISISFSLFVYECLYQCPAILLLILCAYTSLLRVSYSLTLWIPVLAFGYIVTHCTCICTSLHPYLSVFSLWMPLYVFSYIVTYCPCIVSSLGSYFYLCFYLSQ